jgi:hypothetical protein
VIRRRLRFLIMGRLLAGSPRRWVLYLGLTTGIRLLRRGTKGGPEVVYRAVLGPGQLLDVHTDRPLPRRFRSRRLRKRLAAEARAELAAASPSGRRR